MHRYYYSLSRSEAELCVFCVFSVCCVCRGAMGGWAEFHFTGAADTHAHLRQLEISDYSKALFSRHLLPDDFCYIVAWSPVPLATSGSTPLSPALRNSATSNPALSSTRASTGHHHSEWPLLQDLSLLQWTHQQEFIIPGLCTFPLLKPK